MIFVDKNIDEIMKYRACQLIYIKNLFHAQYDAGYVKGYKLRLTRTEISCERLVLEQ